MAKVKLDIGATIDTLSKGELDDSLARFREQATATEQARLRGIKYIRVNRIYGTIASNAVTIGNNPPFAGPASGYAWSVMRLSATGLATGSTPDILNVYRNGTGTDPVWQLNGNNFCYTFSKLQLVLYGGEYLYAANSGSITATGQVTVSMDVIEVPMEFLGKLA